MVNPHACYILGFVTSLAVYLLGWSEFYPRLSYSLLFFLGATIIIHFVLAKLWSKGNTVAKKETLLPRINPWAVTAFIYLLWTIDFLYEGGIPLFKILTHTPFDYKTFGFPSLHVLAVTFSSFYSVYLFHLYLVNRKKSMLLLYAINMLAAILIYSRAMLFFNLTSSGFLFLLRLEKIPYKRIALAIPLAIGLLYLFGVAGTQRVSFESNSKYDHRFFLESAGATRQFIESKVPKEFFWSYFYISSPIANLQLNVTTHKVQPITLQRILEYINNELLFESVSKRINKWLGVEREKDYRTREQFNASTAYSMSYSYLGWAGMCTTALVIMALPFFYYKLIRNSSYRLEAVAILCTTFLFMSYDNTIRLMALGFQLIYPILFPLIEKRLESLMKLSE